MVREELPFSLSASLPEEAAKSATSADDTSDASASVEERPLTPLSYQPYFCPAGQKAVDLIDWKLFHPVIKDGDGNIIFEQDNVEAPVSWSERAVRVVASKYFRGQLGTPQREHSVRQLVARVVHTIESWVREQGYFRSSTHDAMFGQDLAYLLLTQHAAFNSPVWFNLGVSGVAQQASACFIQSVEDNMESIAALQYNETMIFKRGSGSGTNFSKLRSRKETLSGGGVPSGPVSFMSGLDGWGGVIKSGGTTRRAAKMCILNIDHPDIMEYINCKLEEEKKAHALIAAGYNPHFDDEKGAYAAIKFQNANHSVRVTDKFMRLVQYAMAHPDEEVTWELHAVTTGKVIERVPVRTLWRNICEAAWQCGDPGIQFHDTHNAWHTCPSDGDLDATNPCSEYSWLDDTSCNLASLNLLKFRRTDGSFDWEGFHRATMVMITAQEAIVEKAYYPTPKITETTKKYHTLGLGYANLGAYLMTCGLAYDSAEGRRHAANITSEMTAVAYRTSARLASAVGPFEAFGRNRPAMRRVLEKHRQAAQDHGLPTTLWDEVLGEFDRFGARNAQVTLLAPTGTISFMMDCDTTGCEPEISLYKTKHLVGGGVEVLENRLVNAALNVLGYDDAARDSILKHLARHKTLEGSMLNEQHLRVFDCSVPATKGGRCLSLSAHLDMTAALQPFVSGAISKTMNLAGSARVQDVSDAFLNAWDLGIKNITVYRDGCKKSQPLQTGARGEPEQPKPVRRKLSDHQTNTHRIKFSFGNVKGYMLVTPYEDTGLPGEMFVKLAKEGSTISGLVDGWAQAISYCLQFGVPLETLIEKFSNTKFEPSGFSSDQDIKHASSIYDALVRKLAAVFLNGAYHKNGDTGVIQEPNNGYLALDAPICDTCGSLMERTSSTCHHCPECGSASGCG